MTREDILWHYAVLFFDNPDILPIFGSFEVARLISDDSYGLVFGFNTFVALFFQSILTLIVADDLGLALPPRAQVWTKLVFKSGINLGI